MAESIEQVVKVKVFGGEKGPASIIAPMMGKMKINARNVQADIEKLGEDWKGIRITVLIKIKDRKHSLEIENTAGSLLIKALGPEYYERKRKNPSIEKHHGNLTLEQVINVAKMLDLDGKNQSKTMAGHVKTILGSVRSLGDVTVDGVSAKEMTQKITNQEVKIPEN